MAKRHKYECRLLKKKVSNGKLVECDIIAVVVSEINLIENPKEWMSVEIGILLQ